MHVYPDLLLSLPFWAHFQLQSRSGVLLYQSKIFQIDGNMHASRLYVATLRQRLRRYLYSFQFDLPPLTVAASRFDELPLFNYQSNHGKRLANCNALREYQVTFYGSRTTISKVEFWAHRGI